jgi:hypothetical protein
MARIATGDWDAVIVAQSQFTLLPVNPETEADFIDRELAGYREALSEMADEARANGDRSWRSSEKPFRKPSSASPHVYWAARNAWRNVNA